MTGKIGRKKVLKFRDFPTRLHGEVFFVENGYDEKLNLSIINQPSRGYQQLVYQQVNSF